MSIWKNNKLVPHDYERTLIVARKVMSEQLIIWVEGTNMELTFKNFNPFGVVGGAINTNTGVGFTKEMLLEIANKMKEGAILKIAACNSLYLTKEDLKYSNQDYTVEEKFAGENDMIQIGDNSFAPSETVKKFLKESPEKIQKEYKSYCVKKLNHNATRSK